MRRWILVVVTVLVSSCAPGGPPAPATSPTGDPNAWRTDPEEPFPFIVPVPPRTPTPIDGTYTRNVSEGPTPIPCRRCAPYRVDRGPATLRLEAGRFYVDQPESRFIASGHFAIEGETIRLFNDANCPETSGTYRWSLDGDAIAFEVLQDDCAFDLLRARYFSAEPWELAEG